MLEGFLKAMGRWQLPTICTLAGIAFVYLSLFAGFPTPANGWLPPLRVHLHIAMLIVGLFLIAGGASFALVQGRLTKDKRPAFGQPEHSLANSAIPPQEPRMVTEFRKLTDTQQEIVHIVYNNSHKTHLSLDELFKSIVAPQGSHLVQNPDELYYRLKDLEHKGFLWLQNVAKRQTEIAKIRSVASDLHDAGVITSG